MVDEGPAAEYLQQHARQAEAEILQRRAQVADEGPFAQCAERLVGHDDGS